MKLIFLIQTFQKFSITGERQKYIYFGDDTTPVWPYDEEKYATIDNKEIISRSLIDGDIVSLNNHYSVGDLIYFQMSVGYLSLTNSNTITYTTELDETNFFTIEYLDENEISFSRNGYYITYNVGSANTYIKPTVTTEQTYFNLGVRNSITLALYYGTDQTKKLGVFNVSNGIQSAYGVYFTNSSTSGGTVYLGKKYKKTLKYPITLDANGGTLDSTWLSNNYNTNWIRTTYGQFQESQLCDAENNNTSIIFLGWLDEDGNYIERDSVINTSKPITLHPYWLYPTYTITFDASTNGGSCSISSASTKSDGSNTLNLGSLPIASKSGSYFDGWYTSASGSSQIYLSTIFTADTTVYAQFSTIYNITFDFNGGYNSSNGESSTIYSTTKRSKLGYLPNATRSGYTFDGWYTAQSRGSLITTSTTFTNDCTVYAHYTIIQNTDTEDTLFLSKGRYISSFTISDLLFTPTFGDLTVMHKYYNTGFLDNLMSLKFVSLDSDYTIINDQLVESYESDDYGNLVIHIREGFNYYTSDGYEYGPVTAVTLVETINYIRTNFTSFNFKCVFELDGYIIEAIDNYTMTISGDGFEINGVVSQYRIFEALNNIAYAADEEMRHSYIDSDYYSGGDRIFPYLIAIPQSIDASYGSPYSCYFEPTENANIYPTWEHYITDYAIVDSVTPSDTMGMDPLLPINRVINETMIMQPYNVLEIEPSCFNAIENYYNDGDLERIIYGDMFGLDLQFISNDHYASGNFYPDLNAAIAKVATLAVDNFSFLASNIGTRSIRKYYRRYY